MLRAAARRRRAGELPCVRKASSGAERSQRRERRRKREELRSLDPETQERAGGREPARAE